MDKKPFLALKNSIFQTPKNRTFPKGFKPMLLVKKCIFFLEFFSVKRRLEIMFNTVQETKETFFSHKKFNLSKSQNRIFPKGLTHAFGQKM